MAYVHENFYHDRASFPMFNQLFKSLRQFDPPYAEEGILPPVWDRVNITLEQDNMQWSNV